MFENQFTQLWSQRTIESINAPSSDWHLRNRPIAPRIDMWECVATAICNCSGATEEGFLIRQVNQVSHLGFCTLRFLYCCAVVLRPYEYEKALRNMSHSGESFSTLDFFSEIAFKGICQNLYSYISKKKNNLQWQFIRLYEFFQTKNFSKCISWQDFTSCTHKTNK